MKQLILIFALAFGFSIQQSVAQNHFKIGPSAMVNFADIDEVNVPIGVDVAYELAMLRKLSLNLAATVHYSKFESRFRENQIKEIFQEDLLVGAQADVRYHFRKRYRGLYLGVGADTKMLTAKNFFPPSENDPTPTLANLEINMGVSTGFYFNMGKLLINPNIYMGANPGDQNEYVFHTKVGLAIGF